MQVPPNTLQELTSKDDSGGVTGVRWTLSLPSTSVDEDCRTKRGGNVTLLDYLYAFPFTDLFGLLFYLSILIHSPGVAVILDRKSVV